MNEYSPDDVIALTDRMYEAVYDDGRWSEVLAAFKQRFDSMNGAIGYFDGRALVDMQLAADCAPEFAENFMNPEMSNPAAGAFMAGSAGLVFSDQTLLASGALERSTFFNEWLQPQGQRSFLGIITLREGAVVGHLCILRGTSQPAFDSDDLAFLERLSVPLQSAARLRRRIGGLRLAEQANALDTLQVGFLVVDGHGRLLSSNAAGDAFLADPRCGLDVAHGIVTAQAPHERERLRRAVAAACTDVEGSLAHASDLLVSSLETGLPSTALSIAPIRDAGLLGLPVGRAAAIVVQDLAARISPRLEAQIRALFGLTASEAVLAAALASGQTLKQAADERAVSMATARTHLAQVFRKTGTSQQSQLVALLRGILPVDN